MPLSRRQRIAVDQRRANVADLYLQGWTQTAIAEKIGVKQSTICTDLKCVRETWRNSSVRDFDLARDEELQKIDRIQREAWAAWERSQQPQQSATTDDAENNRKTKRHVQNRYGDPRFLDQVQKCITTRCAILGLNATPKLEITTDGDSLSERRDRLIAVTLALSNRTGAGDLGAGPGIVESRLVRSGGEPGEVEAGPPLALPGPGDP